MPMKILWVIPVLFLMSHVIAQEAAASKAMPARTLSGYAEDGFGMDEMGTPGKEREHNERIKTSNSTSSRKGRTRHSRKSKKKGRRTSTRTRRSGTPTLNLKLPL